MDILSLAKSIIAGAGSKLSNDWKKQVEEVSTPQGRQAYQDRGIKFALDNAMMSGGVKAAQQPAALALKMLSKAQKPLGISSIDAADAMRDNLGKVANKALKQGSSFKNIENWAIIDEIVKKMEKGKDTPEDLRNLGETLQVSGFNMLNPSRRMLR